MPRRETRSTFRLEGPHSMTGFKNHIRRPRSPAESLRIFACVAREIRASAEATTPDDAEVRRKLAAELVAQAQADLKVRDAGADEPCGIVLAIQSSARPPVAGSVAASAADRTQSTGARPFGLLHRRTRWPPPQRSRARAPAMPNAAQVRDGPSPTSWSLANPGLHAPPAAEDAIPQQLDARRLRWCRRGVRLRS